MHARLHVSCTLLLSNLNEKSKAMTNLSKVTKYQTQQKYIQWYQVFFYTVTDRQMDRQTGMVKLREAFLQLCCELANLHM
jgi:hypothetical protein